MVQDIQTDSDRFRQIQTDDRFRQIQTDSDRFRQIQTDDLLHHCATQLLPQDIHGYPVRALMPETYAGPDGPGSDLDLVLEFVFGVWISTLVKSFMNNYE